MDDLNLRRVAVVLRDLLEAINPADAVPLVAADRGAMPNRAYEPRSTSVLIAILRRADVRGHERGQHAKAATSLAAA